MPKSEFTKIHKKTSVEIEDFLDGNPPFTKNYYINRYDMDKAWNPTFDLLSLIFCATEDLFKKTEYEIDDTNIFFHNSLVVSDISKKLDTLESTTLNSFLQNREILEKVKSKQGYRMDSIDFPILIEEHFQILKLAYKEAFNKGHCIILIFG